MGFLRRVLASSKGQSVSTREVSPDWASPLPAEGFEHLTWLVQRELGRSRIPSERMLRDADLAASLGLPRLVQDLIDLPADGWAAIVRAFFEQHPVVAIQERGPATLAELAALAAAELGPEVVPDPSRVTTGIEARRLNLPGLAEAIEGRPRIEWPGLAHAYYTRISELIGRGRELEHQVDSLDAARPYLEEMWSGAAGGERVARVPGPLVGTSRLLILHDAAARPSIIRMVGEARLAEIGTDTAAAFEVVRERVRTTPVRRLPSNPALPRIIVLDLSPHHWGMMVVECLDVVSPDAIGPLGTLVALLAPNILIARPIGFDDGIRRDFQSITAYAASSQTTSDHPSTGPLWRRFGDGAVFPIDVTTANRKADQKVSMNLDDQRFRGVLMTAEPLTELPVPTWCKGILDPRLFTRFAGLVAACSTPPVKAELIGNGDPDLLRPVARRCALARLEVWPLIIGLTHRLAIRWTPGGAPTPTTSNLSSPADAVRTKAAPLLALLAETVEQMADVLHACLYFAASLRVTAPDESVLEAEVIALVALAKKADVVAATDRLIVALAEKLPLGMFGIVELAAPDDPRFADVEHVVPLR